MAVARDEDALSLVAVDVKALGRECHLHVCDLSRAESIGQLCETVLEDVDIDILVNNAGVALVAPALDATLADWDASIAINVRAPFQLATLMAPGMIKRRWGKIINISSQAGVIGIENHVAYSSSKAAMNALTRGLMCEWAKYNVQVNSICPTVILTDMGQAGMGCKGEERADVGQNTVAAFWRRG